MSRIGVITYLLHYLASPLHKCIEAGRFGGLTTPGYPADRLLTRAYLSSPSKMRTRNEAGLRLELHPDVSDRDTFDVSTERGVEDRGVAENT